MKSLLSVLLIAAFFILGCSHTYVVDKKSTNEFMMKVNKKTKKKRGLIQTKSGKKYIAKEITITVDSSSWIDTKTMSFEKRANSELYKIVINDRAKGSVFGFLGGFAIGFAIGYAGGDDPPGGFAPGFSAEEKGRMTGAILGLFGGIGGAILGNVDQIRFSERIIKSPIPDLKYYLLRDVRILDETEKQIQIQWRERTVWLEKTKIIIIKQDDGSNIRIPVTMYKEKFGN